MNPTAIARLQDLRVETGGRAIVDGVSLRLVPGKITALIGGSGSGKTTTGLALLHEYPPGAVVTGEVDVPDTLIGYVPQHPATVLNPARPVAALLQDIARTQVRHLPRRARRSAVRHRMLRALDRAQLPDGEALLHRYPHQLSGGQQQRVVLAQALLTGATTLIADEPTTGQDALTKQQITGQLASLARQGLAILLLSHDLEVVHALADDVHVMRAGRIVESGPPERLRLFPRHPWTRELLAAVDSAEPSDGVPALRDASTTGAATTGPGTRRSGPASPRTAQDPVLQVRALTARHGRSTVLHPTDLLLPPGCTAVVGRSGSGKTTLARCLAGLHRTYDGEVLLDGAALPRSLRDRTREQLAAVQYVFQDARSAFDEHRPVLDQVSRTAIRLRKVPEPEAPADAERILGSLGLAGDLVRRKPTELSGGELQRAALARALLARPRVLLCDEITSGLDTVARRNLRTLLADLLRTHPDLSLVLITHDRDTAALAARTAVLDNGRLVEQGPTEQLLADPRHPLTASLLRAAPDRGATPSAAPPDAGVAHGT
ncbi:ABC transporter ATP-binding protein [Streptomyces sp. NRRL S-1813]|uniref:ABC transporter ATP-binding protein n=1 Tax=Streptomyces sp. NRRL S-1813 TaxID=1463888 RepID=UPI000690962C|nr:ATP-binding cassette domain-containing protein [Streptomyces sp. NRRL S-1813]